MPARVKACGHKEHCGEQPGVPQQPAHLALLRHQGQCGLSSIGGVILGDFIGRQVKATTKWVPLMKKLV